MRSGPVRRSAGAAARQASRALAERGRRKFLRYFPAAFHDETYLEWERDYKWRAHERWRSTLSHEQIRDLVRQGQHAEVARRAVAIEGRTNLLFSFEKMAIRDAVRTARGAVAFAEGLLALLTAPDPHGEAFDDWVEVVRGLPRKQTRVATWPVVTVFGFLAMPEQHVFLKPNVTREAARKYGFDFHYRSRPDSETYRSLLAFADEIRRDTRDLRPRDMIDIQSFLWVQGSDEYP